jgi:hypothetical protein
MGKRWVPVGRVWLRNVRLANALVAVLCASCSADPIRELQRQAIGMRPLLLESCLPEAGAVELSGDVERLTYAWTLGERISDVDLDPLEPVGSFQSPAPTVPGPACEVTLEIEDGIVRRMEIGATEADSACARRVRACLATLPDPGSR